MTDALRILALRCLGPPSVLIDGGDPPSDVVWRKHLALLVYLALSPDRRRTRAHLMGLLWAESSDERARGSLNEAVRRLRSALGHDRLLTHGDSLQLGGISLEVDALEFDALCGVGDLRALDLLRGEFLEGLHVEEARAFDAWVETHRARIRDAATQLLLSRAEGQLAVTRYVEARALACRALTLDQHSERALSLAMRSAALDGDPTGALGLYREFAVRLERDLGERPSGPMIGLAERIRSGTWQRSDGRHPLVEPPLIGRRAEHARIFARLDRWPRDGPTCVVISGEGGSGRTRLLRACAERLSLSGARIATVRILEHDHDAPWSTLRALIRGGLLRLPGVAATDHVGLRVLAGLVPELAERVNPLEGRDVAQVVDAFASLLGAIADEQPVAVMVDDAQWADASTLTALRAVWSRERAARLALAVTLQAGVEPSPELQALLGSVGRDITGDHVRLRPLSSEDLVSLVAVSAPWCGRIEDRYRLARRVEHESGGNAFLAVTLLRDLNEAAPQHQRGLGWLAPGATYDSTLPVQISDVVRGAIVARVAKLDEDATAVLRAAGVAGEMLDAALMAEVMGLPTERIEKALDRLERDRFVAFDGARYVFSGRLLPVVIESECTQAGGRRRLRERFVSALASRDDIDSQLLRARLLAADRHADTFDVARRVAERATAIGAERTAATALRIADRAAGADRARATLLDALRRRERQVAQ